MEENRQMLLSSISLMDTYRLAWVTKRPFYEEPERVVTWPPDFNYDQIEAHSLEEAVSFLFGVDEVNALIGAWYLLALAYPDGRVDIIKVKAKASWEIKIDDTVKLGP
jgi:hypothetical protein